MDPPFQEPLEAFLTEPRQLPTHEIRHVGRRSSKRLGRATLGPVLVFDNCSNHAREFCFSELLSGVRQPQVLKDIAAPVLNLDQFLVSDSRRCGHQRSPRLRKFSS